MIAVKLRIGSAHGYAHDRLMTFQRSRPWRFMYVKFTAWKRPKTLRKIQIAFDLLCSVVPKHSLIPMSFHCAAICLQLIYKLYSIHTVAQLSSILRH